MSSFLSKILSDFLIKGVSKLASVFSTFIKRLLREKKRKKSSDKFEESGDEKDLLELESDINGK